jgi:integrase
MPALGPRTPSYRLHKPTGQAVVTLCGRDHYLGKHGTPASRAEYDRLIAEWLCNGRPFIPAAATTHPAQLTVSEVMLAYLRHAEGYYVKNGRPTSEVRNIKLALRPLRARYGHTPAIAFGPLALKAVRQAMVESGLCRNEVNKRTRHVVRMFRWAVENELIPAAVHHGLKAVAGLRKGRTEAREREPVRPVPEEHVEAVRPFVSRQVWAMIELQRLTGMRPGEVVIMRTADLNMTGPVWSYRPASHKTEHHGCERVIYLRPRAQEVLRCWLRTDRAAYLFSAREAVDESLATRRKERISPMTPSQATRRCKGRRSRFLGDHYTTDSYTRAIARACRRAGVPPSHGHRLRHNAATRLRKEFGLEVARVILGHSSAAVTEVYAEADHEKARAVMERAG